MSFTYVLKIKNLSWVKSYKLKVGKLRIVMADNRVWVYGGNNRGRGDYRGVGVNKKGVDMIITS